MQNLIQFYTLLVLVCFVLFKSFNELFENNFLKMLLLLLVYAALVRIVTEATGGHLNPFMYLSGNIAVFLFVPGSYLYLRNQFHQKLFHQGDLLHIIPCALYCVSCFGIYLTEKNTEFFLVPESHPLEVGNWMSMSSTQLPAFYFLVFGYGVIGIYLFLILKIMKEKYGLLLSMKVEAATQSTVYSNGNGHAIKQNGVSYNGSAITEEKIQKMDLLVKEFLANKKPFLQHGYSLKHLAEDTSLPMHHLSAFINKHYKVNFNDFINEYRVNYCKIKLMKEEWKYKKLEAIAEESGFSNRNTFTAAFRRVTGLNPSEFLKTIKTPQQLV